MGFKRSSKYLKNEKINFIKLIIKLINVVYFILLYFCRAISTQTIPKKALIERKT